MLRQVKLNIHFLVQSVCLSVCLSYMRRRRELVSGHAVQIAYRSVHQMSVILCPMPAALRDQAARLVPDLM